MVHHGTKSGQQHLMTCFHLLKGYFRALKCRTLGSWGGPGVTDLDAQREGLQLGMALWRDGAGAAGSSCCVLDCQHSNEGGVKSGTMSFGRVCLSGYISIC